MNQRQLKKLQEIRKILTMENAGFDSPCESGKVWIQAGQVTNFIRDRTRNWRKSWVLDPLDEVIAQGEREIAKRKRKG